MVVIINNNKHYNFSLSLINDNQDGERVQVITGEGKK